MALECDRIGDDCHFLGVHISQLDVRCFTLKSLCFSLKTVKAHECALKLTDLWIPSLLFDLN